MPIAPTYPGVYIQEVSSGVRTITGVATSVTVFVGRAPRGPVNTPTLVTSFSAYERLFGGLEADSTISYGVRDFYLNGGSQAIILRLYGDPQMEGGIGGAISPAVITLATTVAQAVYTRAATDLPNASALAGTEAQAQIRTQTTAVTTAEATLAPLGVTADTAAAAWQAAKSAEAEAEAEARAKADAVQRLMAAGFEAAVVTSAQAEADTARQAADQARQRLVQATTAMEAATTAVDGAQTALDAAQANRSAVEKTVNAAVAEVERAVRENPAATAGPALTAELTRLGSGAVAGEMASRLLATPAAKASVKVGKLNFEAAYEGKWGNCLELEIRAEKSLDDPSKTTTTLIVRERTPETRKLPLKSRKSRVEETFLNVSLDPKNRRYLVNLLASESRLIRLGPIIPSTSNLTPGFYTVAPGDEASDSAPLTLAQYILGALEKTDFNLLCVPPDQRDADFGNQSDVYIRALTLCNKRRAMLIVDPGLNWKDPQTIRDTQLSALNLTGEAARNAAVYFPRILQADDLREGRIDVFPPSGMIAGIMARTDSTRGVWKAPAGLDASLNGVQGLAVELSDDENGILNPVGVNCLRTFPLAGRVVFGSRTMRGADQLADEYKYVPIRRTALFIEESLFQGTKWVVFEPNDEPLWAQIRLNVGAFMNSLFRQGAFQGQTPREAYLVKCDKETTTQDDINRGIVNIIVGFAPLKPAEFVIITLKQLAGQIET